MREVLVTKNNEKYVGYIGEDWEGTSVYAMAPATYSAGIETPFGRRMNTSHRTFPNQKALERAGYIVQ